MKCWLFKERFPKNHSKKEFKDVSFKDIRRCPLLYFFLLWKYLVSPSWAESLHRTRSFWPFDPTVLKTHLLPGDFGHSTFKCLGTLNMEALHLWWQTEDDKYRALPATWPCYSMHLPGHAGACQPFSTPSEKSTLKLTHWRSLMSLLELKGGEKKQNKETWWKWTREKAVERFVSSLMLGGLSRYLSGYCTEQWKEERTKLKTAS